MATTEAQKRVTQAYRKRNRAKTIMQSAKSTSKTYIICNFNTLYFNFSFLNLLYSVKMPSRLISFPSSNVLFLGISKYFNLYSKPEKSPVFSKYFILCSSLIKRSQKKSKFYGYYNQAMIYYALQGFPNGRGISKAL